MHFCLLIIILLLICFIFFSSKLYIFKLSLFSLPLICHSLSPLCGLGSPQCLSPKPLPFVQVSPSWLAVALLPKGRVTASPWVPGVKCCDNGKLQTHRAVGLARCQPCTKSSLWLHSFSHWVMAVGFIYRTNPISLYRRLCILMCRWTYISLMRWGFGLGDNRGSVA